MQDFLNAFLVTERAKLIDRVQQEGERFDAAKEFEKLQKKHEKVFGTAMPDKLRADFERVAREAYRFPRSEGPEGKHRNPIESNPDLFLANAKVKFLEDTREEGLKFNAARELAKVTERYQKTFNAPLPDEWQRHLAAVTENAWAIVSANRGQDPKAAAQSASKPATPAVTPTGSSRSGVSSRQPGGLPDWFPTHDQDQDGQVGLYEWEREKFAEFHDYDRNGDGFIEPAEARRAARPAATASQSPMQTAKLK